MQQLEGIAVDRTFLDKNSGEYIDSEQLEAMMQFVHQGDTVIVHSMGRLEGNLEDLCCIVQNLTDKGVRIEFVKENLSFTGEDSPMANLMLSFVRVFAEFERAIIRERRLAELIMSSELRSLNQLELNFDESLALRSVHSNFKHR